VGADEPARTGDGLEPACRNADGGGAIVGVGGAGRAASVTAKPPTAAPAARTMIRRINPTTGRRGRLTMRQTSRAVDETVAKSGRRRDPLWSSTS
jgi:hypothetical protein